MPQIDVIDSTWIPAPADRVASVIVDAANWARWWPGLDLAVQERRGRKGVRWIVTSVREARDVGLSGTAEVWLEPMFDGVVAHFFLRLHPASGRRFALRRSRRIERQYRARTKRAFWALADGADPDRRTRARSALADPGASAVAGSL